MWNGTHPVSISHQNLSGIDSATKKPLVLIWTNKALFEDFHRKIFNWKRNQSNSRCAYQTTNIALLCKMVRIPFLFPTRKKPFRCWLPNKAFGLDLDKKSFFEDFQIKEFNWKNKHSNSNFQDRCAYQTTTNIALLCKMARVPFLFPTRKNLSGIEPPTKAFGRDLDKKITFWRLSHKDF